MREAVVIFAVILILLAITAIKYRKQIATVIGVGRMLRDAAAATTATRQTRIEEPVNSGKLVSCSKCGTWVPESRAIKFGGNTFFCTDACLQRSIQSV